MGRRGAFSSAAADHFVGLVDERRLPVARFGVGGRPEQVLRAAALPGGGEARGPGFGPREKAAEAMGAPEPMDDAERVVRDAVVELVVPAGPVAEPSAGALIV